MGIRDLAPERAGGMSIEAVLEGLDGKLREQLTTALKARRAGSGAIVRYVYSASELARHLADDGFEVSKYSIEGWRRRNGN